MNKSITIFAFIIIAFSKIGFSQTNSEPWTQSQLMQPEKLAAMINDPLVLKPLIINIGPVNLITGAIKMGPAKEKGNLNELKNLLSKVDREREVVIYCGCCPFKDCPNIRPAFTLLSEMKFTNHKLLNLPQNLKVDWINHGYPMNK